MSTQPTMTPNVPATTTVYERGPNLLVRFIWWLFIGWWASGIAVTIAWVALITTIGIPLGWMGFAWLIQLTVIGIPVSLLMFNRTLFIASLYRY